MKITNFKVVYICPDHNEQYSLRKQHMESLLKNIGFTDIEHYKSGTENYPECLTNATINILENNLDTPIILLEDDVEWTGINEIEYNLDADAIYLGLSKCAGHPENNIDYGQSKFENYSASQVKIINMLSAHAILYISKKYKLAVIDILKQHRHTKYYNDVLMSRIQPIFLVLGQKKPLFYQSSKFNLSPVEFYTNFEINL